MSLPPTDKPFPAKANNSSKARRLERWQSKYFALLRRPTVGVGVEGLGGVSKASSLPRDKDQRFRVRQRHLGIEL